MSINRRRVAVFILSTQVSLSHLSGIPRKLIRKGWEVHVVAGDLGSDLHEKLGPEIFRHEIRIERRPHLIRDVYSIFQLFGLIWHLKPRLVVTATPKASLLGQLVASLNRVPSRIYFLWGLRLEGRMSPLLKVFVFLAELLTASLSTDILAVGKSLAARYVALGLTRENKIRVPMFGSASGVALDISSVGDAEELRRLAKVTFGLDLDSFTVGFVGRLVEEKGIQDFLKAFEIMVDGGQRVQAVVVGRPEGSLSLPPQLELLPGVKHWPVVGDIFDAYRSMDILVLPSAREGLPSVVIEAASVGLASVIYPFPGWEDTIDNGVTGIVSPPDAELLSQWIQELLKRPDFLSRISKAARARVHRDFDKEKVESEIVELLSDPRKAL